MRFEVDFWVQRRRVDDLDVVGGLRFYLEYARSISCFHIGVKAYEGGWDI